MCSKFIGIDNGVTGFIAVIEDDVIIEYIRYPRENPTMILEFLEKHKDVSLIAIEQAMMTTKFKHVSAVAYEVQGRYFMCFDIKKMDYIKADPRVNGWRKKMGYVSKKRNDYKIESIELVKKLFKNWEESLTFKCNKRIDHKIQETTYLDDNLADSCMLAKYAQTIYEERNK